MALIRKRSDSFVETAIDEERVVMSLDNGEFFSLTDTALAIWALIDGTRDRASLLADLAACYDAQADAMEADVAAFLADLQAAGLIEQG